MYAALTQSALSLSLSGANGAPQLLLNVQSLDVESCSAPEDCVMTEWSAWSRECPSLTDACGEQTRSRSRCVRVVNRSVDVRCKKKKKNSVSLSFFLCLPAAISSIVIAPIGFLLVVVLLVFPPPPPLVNVGCPSVFGGRSTSTDPRCGGALCANATETQDCQDVVNGQYPACPDPYILDSLAMATDFSQLSSQELVFKPR